nr:hypothetical protein [Sphingomonas crocodyli]
MQSGRDRDRLPVHFLGKRAVEAAGAQAGFDMGERDLAVESRQCRGVGRQCVALADHEIRQGRAKAGIERLDQSAELSPERVAISGNPQIDIGGQAEMRELWCDEIAMLPGGNDHRRKIATGAQGQHHRRHLDRFRPRADHAQDHRLAHPFPPPNTEPKLSIN